MCRSSSYRSTLDSVERTTCFTKGEPLGSQEVFEAFDFSLTAEDVLLIEAILGDEQLVRETGKTPGSVALDEETSLEI